MSEFSWRGLAAAAASGESGPSGRPLAYGSFALSYWLGQGASPGVFKGTNVVLHAFNAVLVYFLLVRLARLSGSEKYLPACALMAAAVWALHPLQLTAVLYTVQRMTSLSASFVLLGLLVFLTFRERVGTCPFRAVGGMFIGLVVGGGLGTGAKENAVLIVLFVAVIEVTMLRRDALNARAKSCLIGFYGLATLLPIAGVFGLAVAAPESLFVGYEGRSYGPWERLLTQLRVLFYYLYLWVVPLISELSLVHDDIVVSGSVVKPITTFLALLGWFALVLIGIFAVKRAKILAFAVFWFLAGHAMESSVIGLDIAQEHRNYLPLVGPSFLVGSWLLQSQLRTKLVLAFLLPIALAGTTAFRAHLWSNGDALTAGWIRYHPMSARAFGMRAQLLLDAGAPVDQTYPVLAGVARLDAENVTALGEMVRQTAAQIEDGGLKALTQTAVAAWGEKRPPRSVLAENFPEDPEKRLVRLVRELEWRLGHAPISAGTVRALYEFGECVHRKENRCRVFLPYLVRWLRHVAEHRPLTPRGAAVLWSQLARLVAPDSRSDALDYMSRAIRAQPRVAGYKVEHIVLALKAEEWDIASAALSELCSMPGAIPDDVLGQFLMELAAAGQKLDSCP